MEATPGIDLAEHDGDPVSPSEGRPMPIAFDLACIGCNYNLRMLEVSAGCPECGRAVRETMDAFGKAWRRDAVQLWRGGCKWVGISGLLTAAVPLLALGGSVVGQLGSGIYGPVILLGLIGTLVLSEHALWVWGVTRLAGDHPGRAHISTFAVRRLRTVVIANGGIALLAVIVPMGIGLLEMTRMGFDDDIVWMFWGGLVALGVTARAVTVGCLMQLMTRTLGAGGYLWKRRHLIATGTAVIILCAAQGLAALATLLGSFGDDGFFGFAVAVGMSSLLALPVIAVWSAVSVFRAGVAFKLPTS